MIPSDFKCWSIRPAMASPRGLVCGTYILASVRRCGTRPPHLIRTGVPVEKLSLPKSRIKVLLLENIHKSAVDLFKRNGYSNIESVAGALDPEELKERLKNVHILGIRSRTRLTKDILSTADKLLTVGCFCIGT